MAFQKLEERIALKAAVTGSKGVRDLVRQQKRHERATGSHRSLQAQRSRRCGYTGQGRRAEGRKDVKGNNGRIRSGYIARKPDEASPGTRDRQIHAFVFEFCAVNLRN